MKKIKFIGLGAILFSSVSFSVDSSEISTLDVDYLGIADMYEEDFTNINSVILDSNNIQFICIGAKKRLSKIDLINHKIYNNNI